MIWFFLLTCKSATIDFHLDFPILLETDKAQQDDYIIVSPSHWWNNQRLVRSAHSIIHKTVGKIGVKNGEGFYSWGHGTKDLIVADNFKK